MFEKKKLERIPIRKTWDYIIYLKRVSYLKRIHWIIKVATDFLVFFVFKKDRKCIIQNYNVMI